MANYQAEFERILNKISGIAYIDRNFSHQCDKSQDFYVLFSWPDQIPGILFE